MSPIRAKIAVRLACPRWSVIIAPILAWFVAYFLLAAYRPIDTRFAFALYHRVDIPDFHEDAYLKVLRPLVEAYLAFARVDNRHIRAMHLTPSQFDVMATLGDTDGMMCSELSAATLVTKGTLTGVLDRLEAKGLIQRDEVKADRRRTKIRLTEKGQHLFEKIFPAHAVFLRPFFERALNPKEVEVARTLLLRLRDSFQHSS
jgi:MarR family transcriptional regulator, 2-MHQ and catechol-resistance regulon repressor